MPWNFACPDWEQRIREGRSLIPDLPLHEPTARKAVKLYNNLRLPDVEGFPTNGEKSGDWSREIVAALFGSLDPVSKERQVKELLQLVPKKNNKALALDTPVATPTGFTAMGQLQVGDLVIAADGRPTSVTAKSPVYLGRPCLEVVFSTGETVVCDVDHLWVTDAHRDRDRQKSRWSDERSRPAPSVKTAAQIAATLKVPSGRYTINNHRTAVCGALDLPPATLPIPPYVLGLWLGDGSSNATVITAGLDDADHIVEQIAATGHSVAVRARYPEKGSVRISIAEQAGRNEPLAYRFYTQAVRLGLFGNKHVPQVYLRSAAEQRLALLRGMMDSDGSISKAGQAVFVTTSPALRDDARELICSLGFKATVSEQRATIKGRDCGPAWHVQFWPFDTTVFTIPRKVARQRSRVATSAARSRARQIVDVRPAASVPVQCISVASETKQYLVTRSLIPTHNTTGGATLMMVAMLMNKRPRAEMLLVGPTQAISDRAYSQAVGMIEADDVKQREKDGKEGFLKRRFLVRDHLKQIVDRKLKSKLTVRTFDEKILTGALPAAALVDELHLLGKIPYASKVLTQIRDGMMPIPEGFLVYITTQSDDPPAGVFKEELAKARGIRDGEITGIPMLPVLYEFPQDIHEDEEKWKDPKNWPMVHPNLGRSSHLDKLKTGYHNAEVKGLAAITEWASQMLNIEVGLGLRAGRWRAAEHWEKNAAPLLDIETILAICDAVVVGIDGGGLDDLLGMAVLGRHAITKDWLLWNHAWVDRSVLELRKSEASRFLDFEKLGQLTLVDNVRDDVEEVAEIVQRIELAGLLPERNAIGVDPVGIGAIVDALDQRGINNNDQAVRIIGVPQGWRLNGAIKTAERKLKGGSLIHPGQELMAYCVGNAKPVAVGNAITITKAAAGSAKIDPLMATLNAIALMSMNPEGMGFAQSVGAIV